MQVTHLVWPARQRTRALRDGQSWKGQRAATAFARCLLLVILLTGSTATAQTLPPGFTESAVIVGLAQPTAVRFSPDGRVFVAEKSGLVRVFDDLSDSTPTTFADLRSKVHNFWDRGLLGLALHPDFPAEPWVYVLYTLDAAIGGTAPRWGDGCPSPPGATEDGCVVGARLSRLQADGNVMTGSEQVLLEGWGQQYPSHSIGALAFGADGALYVSGGDGASFNFVDYGQNGSPLNPLGDPPVPIGSLQIPPSAEGGALRSQSPRRPAGEPVVLNGAILRVDPRNGAPLPDNPLSGHADPMARRIVGYGLRNPFRITARPGTSEIWIADVGWVNWEELNRVSSPASLPLENFGWPCYEGPGRQPGYDAANLILCEQLYSTPGAVTAPYYTYHHAERIVPGESCPTGSSSITGLAFYEGGSYPTAYNGALFFADFSRRCIWAMFAGPKGLPDPATRSAFVISARAPVDLQIGPGGDLFYVDLSGGTIRRITFASGNQPPTAAIEATPLFGPAPLTVTFSGATSSDPDAGQTLTYSWDLNGDGVFGDSSAVQPVFTYTTAGSYTVRLRVTDPTEASHTASVVIVARNSSPTAVIDSPLATLAWRVGDSIAFSGHAVDSQQRALPASALSWSLLLHHCPSNCHVHLLQTVSGVTSGRFTAPDHENPSHLELVLTATAAGGLQHSTSVILQPLTAELSFQSSPPGLRLAVGATTAATPFVVNVIQGSNRSISASSPQALSGTNYLFTAWSDGGAATHNITAAGPMILTAAYRPAAPSQSPGLVAAYNFDQGSGPSVPDASGNGHTGTISGATWTSTGKYGGALSFDGVNDWVTVADSALLDLTTGMTLSAWVFPTANGNAGRTVLIKESPGGAVYDLFSNTRSKVPVVGMKLSGVSRITNVSATRRLPLDAWTHLAGTYDGATLRLFVNGAQVSRRAVSGPLTTSSGVLRIGGSSVWGEYFAGRIDDVRIYNRALPAAEIQTAMNTPARPPNQPPTAVAQASPLSGPPPLTVTFTGTGSSDPDPGDTLTYAWDLDGDGEFDDSTIPGPTRTYSGPGTYTAKLRVTDSHQASSDSVPIVITVTPSQSPGLVAAYNFDQGSGSSVPDASGNGHTGTISGAVWTSTGKYGGALSFDGVNDWVTVADSALLDLTTGMTLSAWVFPTGHGTFCTVVMKERPETEVYGLYSSTADERPGAGISRSGTSLVGISGSRALPLNTWTHLAVTYDGTTLRLFVNGLEVKRRSAPGALLTSGNPLRIGGNSIRPEFFQGRIDDVRIYDRALTVTEVQKVMNTPLP
jgi:PKD repeat protein/glucose/arabinose dehydrogenase